MKHNEIDWIMGIIEVRAFYGYHIENECKNDEIESNQWNHPVNFENHECSDSNNEMLKYDEIPTITMKWLKNEIDLTWKPWGYLNNWVNLLMTPWEGKQIN